MRNKTILLTVLLSVFITIMVGCSKTNQEPTTTKVPPSSQNGGNLIDTTEQWSVIERGVFKDKSMVEEKYVLNELDRKIEMPYPQFRNVPSAVNEFIRKTLEEHFKEFDYAPIEANGGYVVEAHTSRYLSVTFLEYVLIDNSTGNYKQVRSINLDMSTMSVLHLVDMVKVNATLIKVFKEHGSVFRYPSNESISVETEKEWDDVKSNIFSYHLTVEYLQRLNDDNTPDRCFYFSNTHLGFLFNLGISGRFRMEVPFEKLDGFMKISISM